MSGVSCVVGVDLGSTTTKAVVMSLDGEILGRGITNSRSNYDVACAVARTEAFGNARLLLARRHLGADPALAGRVDTLLPELERSFREAIHRLALSRLGEQLHLGTADPRHASRRPELTRAVDAILTAMTAEVDGLFVPGAERRSDFFRDIAASSFMHLAENLDEARALPFDALVSLFDRAIITVENQELDLSLSDHAPTAITRVAAASGLDGAATDRAAAIVREVVCAPFNEVTGVGTGYGRARLPFPKERIRSEILCHGMGAHAMFPATRTVLDIGGQDTKAIQVDPAGVVTSFQMNDRCAAGCGRYLGYIADEMNMGVHELGPLAMQSTRRVKISSTCTVFAGAELRDRLNLGQRREDILAGLHRAIMLRAMSLLARSGGVNDEFTFTGGVARNEAAVRALVELVEENYGARQLNISADSIYTGALGAALFALRAVHATPQPEVLAS